MKLVSKVLQSSFIGLLTLSTMYSGSALADSAWKLNLGYCGYGQLKLSDCTGNQAEFTVKPGSPGGSASQANDETDPSVTCQQLSVTYSDPTEVSVMLNTGPITITANTINSDVLRTPTLEDGAQYYDFYDQVNKDITDGRYQSYSASPNELFLEDNSCNTWDSQAHA